jgi:hypothetical protein
MRFSRTRLSDIVHRLACAVLQCTFPLRRKTPSRVTHPCARVPRVCLYALAVRGQEPTNSLEEARQFALRQGWQVGVNQCFTDRFGATDPLTRPGWSLVRQQIRAGYADEVVALTHSVVSPHLDEYELQLNLIEEHLGFIALVTAETTAGQR